MEPRAPGSRRAGAGVRLVEPVSACNRKKITSYVKRKIVMCRGCPARARGLGHRWASARRLLSPAPAPVARKL